MPDKLLSPTEPFDYAAARKRIRDREQQRRERNHALFERASKECGAIIEMIRTEFDPLRIYQWGSLLDSDKFDDFSDIDIAVEGIESPKEFFTLYGKAERMTDFPLDLVQIEKIHPLHADSIRTRGRLVYERK